MGRIFPPRLKEEVAGGLNTNFTESWTRIEKERILVPAFRGSLGVFTVVGGPTEESKEPKKFPLVGKEKKQKE